MGGGLLYGRREGLNTLQLEMALSELTSTTTPAKQYQYVVNRNGWDTWLGVSE